MKKRFILLFIIIMTCSHQGLARCNEDDFRPFMIVKINHKATNQDNVFIKGKIKFSENEINRIVYVLNYYNESYVITGNKILVPTSLSNDLDLLANYSKKAFDSNWLNSREVSMTKRGSDQAN